MPCVPSPAMLLQSGSERFETRLSVMAVMSRVIGVHK